MTEPTDLLRSLHVPGAALVLPNAWDVATAKAVAATGFPVVATTSGGVAEARGYHDHHGAPADEMLVVWDEPRVWQPNSRFRFLTSLSSRPRRPGDSPCRSTCITGW